MRRSFSSDTLALLDHTEEVSAWYRHPLNRSCIYTDGVRSFIEYAGRAYWLLDVLMTEPSVQRVSQQGAFVMIELFVCSDGGAKLVAKRSGERAFFWRDIQSTACPAGLWKFCFAAGVLMLPSEHARGDGHPFKRDDRPRGAAASFGGERWLALLLHLKRCASGHK